MTVLSFWLGQLGMTIASNCSGWFGQILILCGIKKEIKKKEKSKPRAKNVAGKFCIFPIKRNRQLIAHIREPMRSKIREPRLLRNK